MSAGFFNPSTFPSSTPSLGPSTGSMNIFSTPSVPDAKLSGIGNPLFSSAPVTGMGDSVKMQDPMNGEVDPLIAAQFEELRKALKENREMSEAFALSTSDEPYDNMHELIEKITREVNNQKAAIKAEMGKSINLLELSRHDNRMAAHTSRGRDMLAASPAYSGGSQLADHMYMRETCVQHEKSMVEYDRVLSQIEELLSELHPDSASGAAARRRLSQEDLRCHIQRFDEIFAALANQVYSLNEAAEKLKDAYLDYRKNLYGRYATNPFEKRQKEEQKEKAVEARYASLKGLDAFPSQTAILSISEYCVPRSVGGQFASMPVVGAGGSFQQSGITTGSLFGGMKPATNTPFTFPSSSVTPFASTLAPTSTTNTTATAASLFSTRPSTFASTAATFSTPVAPVFGATPSNTSAAATTTFGSTLSSSTSGTLFGGSSTLQLGSNKPLFGR